MDDPELLGPAGAALAAELEAADEVPSRRDRFLVPDGVAYLAGNSLGLQPRAAPGGGRRRARGVGGVGRRRPRARGAYPWMPYHETMRETVAAPRRRPTG